MLAPYEGIAVSTTCKCRPISIPSDSDLESHDMEAMERRPTFVVAVWKSDGTAVTLGTRPCLLERALVCWNGTRRCLAMSHSHVVETSGVPQPAETRIANDGALYTLAQFESHYNERADWYWQRAALPQRRSHPTANTR